MKPSKLFQVFAFAFLFSLNAYASGSKRPEIAAAAAVIIDSPAPLDAKRPPEADNVVDESVVEKYSYVDPDHVVPASRLKKALDYYDANPGKIANKNYIVIIDFSEHNSKKRFYLINMQSGDVVGYLTAHGKNSDPDFDGYATKFSNTPESLMSSQGFYLTAETYYGEHGFSLRLDGLSSTNSNARSRAIVIHGADYVREAPLIGRSYGCPALDMRYYAEVINMIKGGTLIYAE